MKVDTVETFIAHNWMFVRIRTDTGLEGIGESTFFAFPEAAAAVVARFAPKLRGQDPMRAEFIFLELYRVVLRSSRDVISMASLPYFVWSFGGDTVDAQGRQDWNNPAAIKALSWVGPDKDAWIVPPLKALDGRTRVVGGSNVLAISKQSKNKEAAATFIRFLLDDPNAVNYFYQTSQQITTSNLDVIRTGPMNGDVYLQQYIEAWNNANLIPITSPRIDAILDVIGLAVQKVINGADPASEVKSLTQAMQAVDR